LRRRLCAHSCWRRRRYSSPGLQDSTGIPPDGRPRTPVRVGSIRVSRPHGPHGPHGPLRRRRAVPRPLRDRHHGPVRPSTAAPASAGPRPSGEGRSVAAPSVALLHAEPPIGFGRACLERSRLTPSSVAGRRWALSTQALRDRLNEEGRRGSDQHLGRAGPARVRLTKPVLKEPLVGRANTQRHGGDRPHCARGSAAQCDDRFRVSAEGRAAIFGNLRHRALQQQWTSGTPSSLEPSVKPTSPKPWRP